MPAGYTPAVALSFDNSTMQAVQSQEERQSARSMVRPPTPRPGSRSRSRTPPLQRSAKSSVSLGSSDAIALDVERPQVLANVEPEHTSKATDCGWATAETLYLGLDLSTPRGPDGNKILLQGGVAVPETYTRIVVINVLQASSLLAADSNGFSDAFATLQLEGAISAKRPLARTKVKKKTLNPKWDETFRIPVIGRVGLLKLQVFDYDLTSANDFLGAAFKSLHMLEPIVGDEPLDSEVVDTWLELGGDTDMGPASGAIHVRIWMEVQEGPPTVSEKERKLREKVHKEEFQDRGIDLEEYYNLAPVDERRSRRDTRDEEKEMKRRARLLAKSRAQRDQLRAQTQRPRWKDKAWEKWAQAGNSVQYAMDRGQDATEYVQQVYRDLTHLVVIDKSSQALRSATANKVKTLHEAIGWSFMVALLIAGFIASLYIWVRDFGEPLSTFLPAECLAISSKETERLRGFGLDPLKRGEILVHVFGSTTPECCCKDIAGVSRCSEWQATAYDSPMGEYSSGSKNYFLVKHGHPGSFYPCWHSLDKARIIIARDWNVEFLFVPILSLISMAICAYQCYKKIRVHLSQMRHYHHIHEIVHSERGLLPEDVWMHEDPDFRPHPKQQLLHLEMQLAAGKSALDHSMGGEGNAHQVDEDFADDDDYPKRKCHSMDELMKRDVEPIIEDDNYPPPGEIDLRMWYCIPSPVRGTLWRADIIRQEELEYLRKLKLWYTFVVFEDGGSTSVAEIKLKCGPSRARWADMKARLVGKLGSRGLLGVARDHSWENQTYCLRYIDPYQKAETQGVEEDGKLESDQMGRRVLVRNEAEWQQCWEIALKEDDNELEVDIVKLNPEDFVPETPEAWTENLYASFRAAEEERRVQEERKEQEERRAQEECSATLKDLALPAHESRQESLQSIIGHYNEEGCSDDRTEGTDEQGAKWTDDEADEGDDGPGRSPDVELTNRSALHFSETPHDHISERRPKSDTASSLLSPRSEARSLAWSSSGSASTEQQRELLKYSSASGGAMVESVLDGVFGEFPSRSESNAASSVHSPLSGARSSVRGSSAGTEHVCSRDPL